VPQSPSPSLRERCRRIIFEAETPVGKTFDVALIISIIISVLAVMLASIPEVRATWGPELHAVEWLFTILFTVEYLARLWSVESPRRYALSFFGAVDLLSIIPTFLSLLWPGAEYLIVIRSLRVLRVFRVLKLLKYVDEAHTIRRALRASRAKILVFLLAISILVTILGSFMYLIEGEKNGFTSIPKSVYWAVVTLTTVGYGDLSPNTAAGRFLASLVMIMGYSIIAVPTGIVTAELGRVSRSTTSRSCPNCAAEEHSDIARFCYRCGAKLN
jgi:voltage-gated potassium channel